MITLQRSDPKVSAFLAENKGVVHGDAVKPSQFAVTFRLGERCVVFNTLTKQCIESGYFDWFEHPEDRPFDAEDVEMSALLKSDFLVSPNLDEATRYFSLIKILRKIEAPKAGYTGYTILPTTSCNARCVYCYEEGIPFESMSDEVVDQILRYIHATRRKDARIGLHWFGGEPLLGERVIDRICAALRDDNVDYESDMITNGSLMTEPIAKKAKEDWHLMRVQITLDGREDMYCARKRYVSFDGSPYRAVLDGIHAVLDQNIRVVIRLNVDEENLDDMVALVDELENEFEEDGLVSAYCHSTFSQIGKEYPDKNAFYERMEALNDRLSDFNANRRERLKEGQDTSQQPIDDANIQWESSEQRCPEENGEAGLTPDGQAFYDRRGFTKRYYCMVDSPTAGGVIQPNGSICLCEHIGGVPIVGTVSSGLPSNREQHVDRSRADEKKCRACPLLPICTDFTSCPVHLRDCRKELLSAVKKDLRDLEHEQRLPPIILLSDSRIVRVVEPSTEFAEKCTALLAGSFLKPDDTITCEEAERMLFGQGDGETPTQRQDRLAKWTALEQELESSGRELDSPEYLVLEDKKLAYLVNSKAACSSIKASMVGAEMQDDYSVHGIAHDMGLMHGAIDNPNDYFVFTFVRNPFDRLVSCYESKYHTDLRSRKKPITEFDTYLEGYLKEDRGFDEFVRRVCSIPDRLMERHIKPQYRLVYSDEGSCRCNFMGSFENIQTEYEAIRERYGLGPLPHFNPSHAGSWKDYYTEETAVMVHEKYVNDFAAFGYEESYTDLLDYLRNKKNPHEQH